MNPLINAGAEIAWHGFKRWISVLVWTLVLAGIGWAIYAGIIRPVTKPNPSTTQQGARDNYSYTIQPKSYFGCMRIDIKKPEENKPIQEMNK